MALQSTDLLVVQRPDTKQHYKLEVSNVTLPDGNKTGDTLSWNGTTWQSSDKIDGGEYAIF